MKSLIIISNSDTRKAVHLLKAGAVRVRKRKLPISYEANLSLIKNKKFHVRRLHRKAENPKPNAFVF